MSAKSATQSKPGRAVAPNNTTKPKKPVKPSNTAKPDNTAKPNGALKPEGGKPTATKAKAVKAAAQTDSVLPPPAADACPRGGAHEWTTEAGETACAKCHEPAAKAAKSRGLIKQTSAKPAAGRPAQRGASKGIKTPRTSALEAAARVLSEAKQPLTTREMIDAMAAKGYWKSPGGKTPQATLYSAILREITTKKTDARFKKTARGKFAVRGPSAGRKS